MKTDIVELTSTKILCGHLFIFDISIQKYCHSCFSYPPKLERNFFRYSKYSGSKPVVRKSLFSANISNIKKHIKNYQKNTVLFIGEGGCTVGLTSRRTIKLAKILRLFIQSLI